MVYYLAARIPKVIRHQVPGLQAEVGGGLGQRAEPQLRHLRHGLGVVDSGHINHLHSILKCDVASP